ncbi:MAG: DUF3348 family protein [Rhodocyclaceae bacterium]|nr:DUF3348 family protein [Rhodocyclaceae bacterium]
MTRLPPRTNFNSSRLLRLLGELALIEPDESEHDLAEQLGQWLDFTDAIALFAAHNEGAASTAPTPSAHSAQNDPAHALTEIRSKLTVTIRNSCAPTPTPARIRFPVPRRTCQLRLPPITNPTVASIWRISERWKLHYVRCAPTRVPRSPAPIRMLGARHWPPWMRCLSAFSRTAKANCSRPCRYFWEKRFARLRAGHLENLDETGGQDDPALWLAPGAWLAVFRQDIAAVLLAELELRLQPTLGLLEALRNEKQHSHD